MNYPSLLSSYAPFPYMLYQVLVSYAFEVVFMEHNYSVDSDSLL